jgi:hypothetical protein
MGAAFVTRRGGGGGYTRLEKQTSTIDGSGNPTWKNLAVATNIYFLQATAYYTDDWTEQSSLEAFIEDGEIEVLSGSLNDFKLTVNATSISMTTPYGNTQAGGTLYRFC